MADERRTGRQAQTRARDPRQSTGSCPSPVSLIRLDPAIQDTRQSLLKKNDNRDGSLGAPSRSSAMVRRPFPVLSAPRLVSPSPAFWIGGTLDAGTAHPAIVRDIYTSDPQHLARLEI